MSAEVAITKGGFSGHETFPFRFAWLPRAVAETAKDSEVFGREDAIVRFGVGKNMVRSIRHWGLACGLLEEVPETRGRELRTTRLGTALFAAEGWDPYFEDSGTAWLLHWNLASTAFPSTTWYWTFNHAPQNEFTRDELLRWLTTLAEQRGWTRAAESSLKRDVETFLRTYVPSRATRGLSIEDTLDCPLVELQLIRELPDRGTYAFSRGQQPSLPDELFAYALAEQLRGLRDAPKTVPLHAVAFAPGSPGRVFCLSEDALLVRLERVAALTRGGIVFDETAGLRQLLVSQLPDSTKLLERYYSKSSRVSA